MDSKGGIIMTELNELLYDKKLECPVCNKEFATKKVRVSRLKLIKRDEDLLSYYEGENPLIYNVFVCPNCGYAATESRFDSVSAREKKILLEEVASKWSRRSYGGERSIDDAIVVYKLALYIGQVLDYDKVELGTLTHSIAWLYRIKGDEEEIRFLSVTKDLYEYSYYNESLINAKGTKMDEIKLAYLLGEINRRLGNKEEAFKWFNGVISNPDIKSNPMLEKMAREQWRLTRNE